MRLVGFFDFWREYGGGCWKVPRQFPQLMVVSYILIGQLHLMSIGFKMKFNNEEIEKL